jgi:16S rRNA (cytidine1402-2'-O)-methyltransferase
MFSFAGFEIVDAAVKAGIRIIPVPGPSSLLAALVASGLPSNQFHFVGFLPAKKGATSKLGLQAPIPTRPCSATDSDCDTQELEKKY